MTTSSKELICVSNPYQTTVNCQVYLFSNKSKHATGFRATESWYAEIAEWCEFIVRYCRPFLIVLIYSSIFHLKVYRMDRFVVCNTRQSACSRP